MGPSEWIGKHTLKEKLMASRRNFICYDPALRKLARQLRKNGTLAEALLWREISRKKLGCEFHRQVPIHEYIVDFFCHELMLAIEIDGCSHRHDEAFANDRQRQEHLECLGITLIRFAEKDVRNNLHGVVEAIRGYVNQEA